MDDAVEFGKQRERAMRGRLRRRSAGAQENKSREEDSPHEEIVCVVRIRGSHTGSDPVNGV